MRVALVQMLSGKDKLTNLESAKNWARQAAENGAELVVFPEAVMRAFGTGRIDKDAEPIDGEFADEVVKLAEELGIVIVLGMFEPADTVERDGKEINRIYNTALIAGAGERKSYHKIHTYDAFGFKESDTIKPGHELVSFEVKGVKIGVAVCYDVRFPELFKALAKDKGVHAVALPTSWADGPDKLDQWRLLSGTRALDSTCYILAAGQARPGGQEAVGREDGPTGIGHSAVVGPDGIRIVEAGYDEEIIYADIDVETVEKTRKSIPVLGALREFN